MAVKGKREGRRKHRATRIKLEARHELARKYVQNKINKDQLERQAGPALEGVMKAVASLQETGKRRAPAVHAPTGSSPSVQEALKGMDARMASREAARVRRIQEQRKPPPPPPKSKKRFQRGGPRPSGPMGEGQGPRPGFGPRPDGMQGGDARPPFVPRPPGSFAPAAQPPAPPAPPAAQAPRA